MDRAELLDKIRRIDENAFFSGTVEQGVRAKMVIIGASALLLCELSQKGVTKDVTFLRQSRLSSDLFRRIETSIVIALLMRNVCHTTLKIVS